MRGGVIDLCDDEDDFDVAIVDKFLEDEEALFDFAGLTNLSRDAGYSPAPAPSSSRQRVVEPAPKKAKPEKRKKARTEQERLDDLEARCHEDVMKEAEFLGGLEASSFAGANVVLSDEMQAAGCLEFVCKSRQESSGHVLRLMSGSELLKMLREQVRVGQRREVVDTIENMDALAETLKDAHKGKQITVVLFETEKAFKDVVRQGLFDNVAAAREAVEKATARLQARYCCNVTKHKTLREAGVAVGKIAKAIASHLDDADRANSSLHGPNFTVDANIAKAKKSSDRRELWTTMLTAIPGVSRACASAIVAQFPTLQSLMTAYNDKTRSEQTKKLLLSEIVVGKKKLGPKKSERIFTVFTTMDGSEIIKGDA